MRNLSSVILCVILTVSLYSQSPHGADLKIACADCHNPNGWKMVKGEYTFNHNSTKFALVGQHQEIDCKMCHTTLEFSKAETSCMSCHTDIHFQTVGFECESCHTPKSWLVEDITKIHQRSRFPLVGAHATADCFQCHPSSSFLRFEVLGVDCIDCHEADYLATTKPNHVEGNYSFNCYECHSMNAFSWTGADINHSFFPLTGGHDINDCNECHVNNDYTNISPECVSCHQTDYNTTSNPSHITLNFSTICTECHTLSPEWKPAEYKDHDFKSFPIYSGKHNGEWNSCVDCHTNPGDYSQFTCIDCHEHNKGDTDKEHDDVGGYIYNSTACFECHPTGDGEGGFNHNTSNFPLTGAHIATDCAECHTNGFSGTPTLCSDCHIADYNQTTNPNHLEINLLTVCSDCHTTMPEWKPATFAVHNDYYPLTGAHTEPDCFTCHQDNYVNTPNQCVGCHLADYNQTNNPPHESSQFGIDCESCHSNIAWTPATFDHDGQYFPIYSGKHNGEWTTCIECHTTPNNYVLFSCIDCHDHNKPETDDQHNGIGGYAYISTACFECHPTGDGEGGFNHNNSNFPLTGAHITVDCNSCHENGYAGTTTICGDCHNPDYNQTTNPSHITIGISNECLLCHTTTPDWKPALFPSHNDYYLLQGAHAAIANDCFTCHNGDYNNTQTTCFGCHSSDFNQTTNPNHQTAQFPTDCEPCHTQSAWVPSTFNHDVEYFPIYSGKHNGEWDLCSECHQDPSNYAVFTCITCHQQGETNNDHEGVSGYQYNSEACYACHPDGNGEGFNHNATNFPLTGAHTTVDCALCHENGYTGTSTVCSDCHQTNYDQSTNPNHTALNIPTLCSDCHSTNPDWNPATFPIHNNYYPLTGGHATISNDCYTCHSGDYNNTTSVCYDCHTSDYTQTTNPNHIAIGIPNVCNTCHTTNPDWNPATFDLHNNYYVLEGAHIAIANDCSTCHNGDYNNTPNTCFGCHETDYNQTTDPSHQAAQFPTDCESCHTQSAWTPSTFDHDSQYFPIYSGKHNGEWDQCSDCHNNPSDYSVFTCLTCHTQGETNNDHEGVSGYQYNSEACYACHPTGDGDGFNHDASNFPLTGAHTTVDCALCHENGYGGTSTVCSDCHTDDYNGSTNPNHITLNIPTECIDCHTTDPDWNPATFDIHGDYYPLTGGHAAVADECYGCHAGDYNNTSSVCFDCHTSDYNQTANPNHITLDIPNVCGDCHTTDPDWDPATFDIHNDYYVLAGAHVAIADNCTTCHNGNYNNTPNTCFGCHETDYNQTTDPAHLTAQFPIDCETCHTQNVWDPSTFAHDAQYFPIYSGEHNNEWDQCSDCHTNPSDYSVFTCLTCHSQNETNNDHEGVSGYQYNSYACLNCHPNGSENKMIMKKKLEQF